MKSILVADDSPTFLTLEKTFLRDFGVQIHSAQDGLTALRVAREQRPDLILLDCEMPGLGGLECLRLLRADPLFAQTPIILISTLTDAETIAQAKSLGASDYLGKPINRQLLQARIGRFLA